MRAAWLAAVLAAGVSVARWLTKGSTRWLILQLSRQLRHFLALQGLGPEARNLQGGVWRSSGQACEHPRFKGSAINVRLGRVLVKGFNLNTIIRKPYYLP